MTDNILTPSRDIPLTSFVNARYVLCNICSCCNALSRKYPINKESLIFCNAITLKVSSAFMISNQNAVRIVLELQPVIDVLKVILDILDEDTV